MCGLELKLPGKSLYYFHYFLRFRKCSVRITTIGRLGHEISEDDHDSCKMWKHFVLY
jgi:hypothetical protein